MDPLTLAKGKQQKINLPFDIGTTWQTWIINSLLCSESTLTIDRGKNNRYFSEIINYT